MSGSSVSWPALEFWGVPWEREFPDHTDQDEYLPQMSIGVTMSVHPKTRCCWSATEESWEACDKPSTAPLGLCDQHFEELCRP